MTKINKIVTSETEGRESDRHVPNTYTYDEDGVLIRHDSDSVAKPVVGPGILFGAGKDSSDQSGLNTIKLIPNSELGTDQYLIIEPTNPNHIHIRAGGTQDESNADLILGGERNNVYIEDDARIVSISTRPQRIENTYQNLNEASSSEFITNVLSEITFDYNVVVDGVTYTVTNVDISGQPVGLMAITAAGATFQPGVSYTFTFEQPWNNYWQFGSDGYLTGPAMGGLFVNGILNGESDLWLQSNDNVVINGNGGGEFLGNPEVPANQIATIGDISSSSNTSFQSVRYTPTFTATGLSFTGTGATHPTYNSYYVKQGQLVSFVIEVDLSTVTNFGTGQYKLQLPFTPVFGFNHFSGWAWADPNISPDIGTGHTIINADTAGVTDILDLHYLKSAGGANAPIREGLFVQGTPVTLTTISKIYVNGTYIAAS
jgi:hypothetical protein